MHSSGLSITLSNEAEVDDVGRSPPRAAAVDGLPVVGADVHRPKKPQIVAAPAAVVEHREGTVEEAEPEQMLEWRRAGRAAHRRAMAVDRGGRHVRTMQWPSIRRPSSRTVAATGAACRSARCGRTRRLPRGRG